MSTTTNTTKYCNYSTRCKRCPKAAECGANYTGCVFNPYDSELLNIAIKYGVTPYQNIMNDLGQIIIFLRNNLNGQPCRTSYPLDCLERLKIVKWDHWSYSRGYISRKIAGYAKTYSGRFGTGIILDAPTWRTTNFFERRYYLYTPTGRAFLGKIAAVLGEKVK